jgi:hypothetical protein
LIGEKEDEDFGGLARRLDGGWLSEYTKLELAKDKLTTQVIIKKYVKK